MVGSKKEDLPSLGLITAYLAARVDNGEIKGGSIYIVSCIEQEVESREESIRESRYLASNEHDAPM